MASWNTLPVKLQLMVMKMLLDDPGSINIYGPFARLSTYAAINKEWQAVERRTFRRLKLCRTSLTAFDRVVRRQRGLVEHIWLCIRLKPYGCPSCDQHETKLWSECHEDIVSTALWSLFRILSQWETHGNRRKAGITLEISVHSPSDSEHAFQNYLSEIPVDSTPIEPDAAANIHDPAHGWTNGRRTETPKEEAISRVFVFRSTVRTPINMNIKYILPKVNTVKQLLIRRQFSTVSWRYRNSNICIGKSGESGINVAIY
ncbi:hypothetical protein OIDMADRAFT_177432 [Oidiodendron maius Zn]|uniref:F-box domain-containing protein n=1 Tax=Oidiodendron maius (strain Zn) TaxID=913774 RepID=A0A0C3D1M4_OIDMZ|nr:hypothetical protein OIDMADRAFT_177432 [Oidiodendron maius Zn]